MPTIDDNFRALASALYFNSSDFGYPSQLTQDEIAQKLKVSRWTVVQAIKQAEKDGIVKHSVQPGGDRHHALEFRLYDKIQEKASEEILNSTVVRVVERSKYPAALWDDPQFRLQTVGRMAAGLATELIGSLARGKSREENVVIVLSHGTTLLQMANAVAPLDRETKALLVAGDHDSRLHVVPAVGGVGGYGAEERERTDTATVVDLFSSRLECGVRYRLPAPMFVMTRSTLNELLGNKLILPVVKRWDDADILFTGIGAVQPTKSRQLLDELFLDKDKGDLNILEGELQAAGDMTLSFFDRHGRKIERPEDPSESAALNEQARGLFSRLAFPVSVGLDRMRKMAKEKQRYCVAVGEGRAKALAFVGALRGGLINGLVTDSDTAQAILDHWDESKH